MDIGLVLFCEFMDFEPLKLCSQKRFFFSSPFQLKRGVRRGDPLSPYFFLIAIEIMAISIRTNKQIEGIKIGEEETKPALLYGSQSQRAILFILPAHGASHIIKNNGSISVSGQLRTYPSPNPTRYNKLIS